MKHQQSHHIMGASDSVFFYTYNDLSISIKKIHKTKDTKILFLNK